MGKLIRVLPTVVALGGAYLLLAASPGLATMRYVANNGVDSPTCGAKSSPCRSISRAITNATHYDTIIVGPGAYGDLNLDGILGQPGEEAAPASCTWCMIHVNKALTIISRDGAAATLLNANSAERNVVQIDNGWVTFGKTNKGFTVAFGIDDGVSVGLSHSEVRVGGNIAVRNGEDGFEFGSLLEARDNRALNNGAYGFYIRGGTAPVIRRNVALNNLGGFYDEVGAILEENIAIGNLGVGIYEDRGAILIRKNMIRGNGDFGIEIGVSASANEISGNTIVGNAADDNNCGIYNDSPYSLGVSNNYFGPGGPGPDPADNVGGVCDGGTGVTTAVNSAASEIKVRVKALK